MPDLKKILFIVNPISGATSKAQLPVLIDQLVDGSKYEYRIVFTDYRGQATALAAEAAAGGINIVVAAGGDGTINEIGKVLINTPCALGIIPVGSGNGLARHMAIPLEVKIALQVINQGKVATIDAGMMNEHIFFCTAGVGFDAHVGSLFAEKTHRGLKGYITTTVREFFSYQPETYHLTIDDTNTKVEAFLITFANGSQYGNNAYIAPQANIQDQMLDICILKKFPLYAVSAVGLRVFTRQIQNSEYYSSQKVKQVVLQRKADGMVHLDGEPMRMGKELEVKVLPHCLKIIVP